VLYRSTNNFPVTFTDTGQVAFDESLLGGYYLDLLIDVGIWLYLLLAVLAVAYIVELTIHGEYPEINAVISHALTRWWAAIRAGMLKVSLLMGVFLTATLIGSLLALLIGGEVGMALGIGLSILIAAVPALAIGLVFFFDMFAASLRDVGGREALAYSLRVGRKHWGRVLGALFSVLMLVSLPSIVFQFGLVALGAGRSSVGYILMLTFFTVVEAFAFVVYALVFLNLDYQLEDQNDAG
jgi:hypothetical protein